MIAGCYTLDLYCDNQKKPDRPDGTDGTHAFREFPHQYTDELGSVCRSRARKAGWKLNLRTGKAFCPKCQPASDVADHLDGMPA